MYEESIEQSLVSPGHFGASLEKIVILKNFVETSDIKKIQNFVETINLWDNGKETGFNEDGVCDYDANYWRDRVCDGLSIKTLNPEIFNIVEYYIDKMKKVIEDKHDVEVHSRPPVIVRWIPGNVQSPHSDKQLNDGSPNPFPTYDINSVIYWNDNFEGGEFYYPEYDIELKIEAGMAVAHPGDIHYLHGVKPVVSGTRWTTPSFYTITKLKD